MEQDIPSTALRLVAAYVAPPLVEMRTVNAEIVEKLKRKRGYNDGRIRPYPFDPTHWIAETYIPGTSAKKTWKVLHEEKSDRYQLFATPEQAAASLEDWINRFTYEEE